MKAILIHGGPGFGKKYLQDVNLMMSLDEVECHMYAPNLQLSSLQAYANELKIKIESIDPDIIYAHSFGTILLLNYLKHYLIPPKDLRIKFVISNWVYNDKWIIDFHNKNPNFPSSNYKKTKENFLHYLSLYKISRIDNLFEFNDDIINIKNCFKGICYRSTLETYSNKISSIISYDDAIVPLSYYNNVNLKSFKDNIIINTNSHFPFINNNSDYKRELINIIKS